MPKYWSAGYPLSSRGEKLIPTLPPTPTLTLPPNQVRLEPMLSCIVAGFLLCNVLGQRGPFSALLHTVTTPALSS